MAETLTVRERITNESRPGESQSPILGRVWTSFLGLGLMVCGSFFCWWLWATWKKAGGMDDWVAVPCRIVSSGVETWRFSEYSKPTFQPVVVYAFEYGGRSRESDKIRRVEIRSAQEARAKAWAERYPTGSEATAYVDPRDPARSVLKKDSKAAIYSIWFPALFVVGGAGIIAGAWWRKPLSK